MKKPTVVIVGASHAGAQLCTSLRQNGWDGDIVMIGDESYLPYHRPPLSKTFLSGEASTDSLLIRPPAFYQKNGIQFRQGRVIAIERARQALRLADASSLAYDKLALCLGARVRKIELPGAELPGVHYLRDIADVEGIKEKVENAKNAVVIGGGYIGLETAASLRKRGIRVVVLELAERILQRVTAPELSDFYTRVHTEEGVLIQTGVSIERIVGSARVEAVACANGLIFPADLVIVGVGVVPNVELAESAGIAVNNGIIVNAHCQTNDPDIVAAGDCTNHFNQHYNRSIRLESVPNALEQAKVAAALLCGVSKEYKTLPWFWSDQYDLKLQIAGISQGYDHLIIRGNPHKERSFAAFYFKHGQLIAADCVNRPQEFIFSKGAISDSMLIDPKRLADDSIPIKAFL